MSRPTLKKYQSAVEALAKHHGYEVHLWDTTESDSDEFLTYGFKVFEPNTNTPIAGGMWVITTCKNESDSEVIESMEYLLKPAQCIPSATQDEFQALIEQDDV